MIAATTAAVVWARTTAAANSNNNNSNNNNEAEWCSVLTTVTGQNQASVIKCILNQIILDRVE